MSFMNSSKVKSKSIQSFHNQKFDASKSKTLLPSLEASTQPSIQLSSKNTSRLEKRIPKAILNELQNTSSQNDFFVTQYELKSKEKTLVKRCQSSENVRLAPIIPKKKKNIDIILNDLNSAAAKLRNIRFATSTQNRRHGSIEQESPSRDDDKLDKEDMPLMESVFSSKNQISSKFANIIKDLPNPDNLLKIQQSAIQIQDQSQINQKNMSKMQSQYDSRQQQVEIMQKTMMDGLNKYNNLIKEIQRRKNKLNELQLQLNDLHLEEKEVELMRAELEDNSEALQGQINIAKENLEYTFQEGESYQLMKDTRKRDLEIIKKFVDEVKKLNQQFGKVLENETDLLLGEAKEMDQIRNKFQEVNFEKQINEDALKKIIEDHRIITQNEMEVIKCIEREQEAKRQLEEIKKKELEEQKQREHQEWLQERSLINLYLKMTRDFNLKFMEIKKDITKLETIYDIIPVWKELNQTNQFSKEKQLCLQKDIKELKNQIQTKQQEIQDKQIQQYMQSSQGELANFANQREKYEDMIQEKNQLTIDIQNIQSKQNNLIHLQQEIKKGFHSLHQELKNSVFKSEQQIIEDYNSQEIVQQSIINGLSKLRESLLQKGFDKEQIEDYLDYKKGKQNKHQEDNQSQSESKGNFNQIQEIQEEDIQENEDENQLNHMSSVDFGDSQVENFD